MSQFRTYICVLIAAAALGGCSSGPEIETSFVLRMPQFSADVIFAEVSVEQGGVVQGVELAVGEDTASFLVVAGEPVTISATVFRAQTNVWEVFTAQTDTVPDGALPVEVNLAALPSRTINVTSSFVGGEVYSGSLSVSLVDDATGITIPITASTGMPLTVPEGRPFTLVVDTPDGGMPVSVPVPDAGQVGTMVDAVLGMPPMLPTVDAGLQNLPAYTPGPDLTPPMGFTLECSTEDDCATATAWQSCDSPLALSEDRDFDILVRLVESPGLGCGTVTVGRDTREPFRVEVAFQPPFLLDSVAPQAQAIITANEPLDATSFTLDAGGSDLCTSVTVLAPNEIVCDADFAGQTGVIGLRANGSDAAGNTFSIPTSFHRLPAPPPAEPVQIVAARTFPGVVRPGMFTMLVAVDVANFSTTDTCTINVSADPVLDPLGTPAPAFAQPGAFYTADGSLPMPTAMSATNPSLRRYWGEFTFSVPAMEGTYRSDMVVDAFCMTMQTPFPRFEVAFDVELPDPRWLGDVLHFPLAVSEFYDVPLPDQGNMDFDLTSSDTSVLVATGGDGVIVNPMGPGETTLTVTAMSTGATSDARVILSPHASRVTLHSTQVLVEGTSIPFDASIGSPLRVLWDSAADSLWVVGSMGFQQLMPTVGTAQGVPCGGTRIADAAMSGIAPVHSSTDASLALLVDTGSAVRHCEVGTVSGTTDLDAAVPTTCADASRLLADTVGGTFVVLGTAQGCISQYHTRTGSLVELDSNSSGQPATILDAELDPFNGFVATVENQGAAGWFLSGAIERAGPYDVGSPISRVTNDRLTGIPMYGVEPISAPNFIHRAAERGGGVSPADSGFNPGTVADPWAAIVHDAGARTTYAYDQATPPNRWEFRQSGFDPYGAQSVGSTNVALSTTEPVLDALVMGPQPHSVEPFRAIPGGVVTIRGSGFGAAGSNEVYVNGLPAKVGGDGPHHITFEVPRELEKLTVEAGQPKDIFALIHVESHGRASGNVANAESHFAVMHPSPFRRFNPTAEQGEICTSCTEDSRVLETGRQAYAIRSVSEPGLTTMVDTAMFPTPLYTVGIDVGPAFTPLGQPAVGTSNSGNWVLTHMPPVHFLTEPQRTPSLPPTLSGVTDIALASSSDFAAVLDSNGVHLLTRGNLEYLAGPLAGAPSQPADIEFMPGTSILLALNNAGQASAWRMPTAAGAAPSPVTINFMSGGCPPATPTSVLELAPVWGEPLGVGVVMLYSGQASIIRYIDIGTEVEARCEGIVPYEPVTASFFPSGEAVALYRLDAPSTWELHDFSDQAALLDSLGYSSGPANDVTANQSENRIFWTEGSFFYTFGLTVTP